jgi:outer membrane immunogenic protein
MSIFTSTRAIAIAAFGVLALSTAASAADLPSTQPYAAVAPVGFSWTGFYLGAQAGYGWGEGESDIAGFGYDVDGWTAGIYGGYNHQFTNGVVVGLEADINYADFNGSGAGVGAFGAFSQTTDINWDGAVRARLGYGFDRFLVYVAGGVAFADIDVDTFGAGGALVGSGNDTAVGWTIGAGVEAAVTQNLAVRAEYRYTNYDDVEFDVAGTTFGDNSIDNHKVLVGVSYKF